MSTVRTLLMTGAMTLAALAASSASGRADPYRYCAEFTGGELGGYALCYYYTLEQCRATISGVGGFCRENLTYDGRPFSSQAGPDRPRKRAKPVNRERY